ncbi:MAG TPA: UDP-N-acetylmuramoyl-tripeptide--D-alanyl-D-alanine ligase [Candidatus Tenderia electrophaga]|uniref:UDP-N-acetylmuramoyl-tripeptide--D-alanyl-D-alanine ligase n=1 Tax=Candidatus Tenderia electrophaga TaxID=1748243 RepID=A0A832J5H6_9GAMM|nr:UDP-N-acetylmuramoyl-tripeptide--D-alanyl-D-alanine ligase [Candidatus Tenderia electrophaga]
MLDAELVGEAQASFDAVSIDSRKIAPGDLFVALQGPNFDGHEFVASAAEQGAVAALVSQPLDIALPQLIVADTRLALGRLAAAWRTTFQGKVIAVTGSNGKTTVKEMLACILAQKGPVLATEGNLNNDIGVPLMLLRIKPQQHQFAVIEMGANHVAEIAYLTSLAQPDVALVTNAATAHLEGFGTLEDVASAKAEIWQGLGETGTAVVNQDDEFAGYWTELTLDYKQLGFGMLPTADVSLADGGVHWEISANGYKSRFSMLTPVGQIDMAMNLAGRHNVMNALAATASALAAGASAAEIQVGLEGMAPVKGRLQPKVTRHGQLLIDDSYNANPHSFRAAIDVLLQAPGEKVLVMGDMAELGATAAQHHFSVGEEARKKGIDRLLACGNYCSEAVKGFGDGAACFATQQELVDALSLLLAEPVYKDAVLLVKGSRGAAMNKVVDALVVGGEDGC